MYHTGDVVWGPDPFHDDDPALAGGGHRPWLILSTERFPGQGEDFLCCALTSFMKVDACLVRLEAADWEHGGPTRPSQIDPSTLMTIKRRWVRHRVGSLKPPKVNRARNMVKSYL